jgi:hypothetical protein
MDGGQGILAATLAAFEGFHEAALFFMFLQVHKFKSTNADILI